MTRRPAMQMRPLSLDDRVSHAPDGGGGYAVDIQAIAFDLDDTLVDWRVFAAACAPAASHWRRAVHTKGLGALVCLRRGTGAHESEPA